MSSMNVAFSLSSFNFDIQISKRAKDEKKEFERIYNYEKRQNKILEQKRIHQALCVSISVVEKITV